MNTIATPGRANSQGLSCKLLTVLAFCAIVVHTASANANVANTISVVGNSAFVSYADVNGNMRASTSSAVQAQVSQIKGHETSQAEVKPTLPEQQVHSGDSIQDKKTGIARLRVGLAGR